MAKEELHEHVLIQTLGQSPVATPVRGAVRTPVPAAFGNPMDDAAAEAPGQQYLGLDMPKPRSSWWRMTPGKRPGRQRQLLQGWKSGRRMWKLCGCSMRLR